MLVSTVKKLLGTYYFNQRPLLNILPKIIIFKTESLLKRFLNISLWKFTAYNFAFKGFEVRLKSLVDLVDRRLRSNICICTIVDCYIEGGGALILILSSLCNCPTRDLCFRISCLCEFLCSIIYIIVYVFGTSQVPIWFLKVWNTILIILINDKVRGNQKKYFFTIFTLWCHCCEPARSWPFFFLFLLRSVTYALVCKIIWIKIYIITYLLFLYDHWIKYCFRWSVGSISNYTEIINLL